MITMKSPATPAALAPVRRSPACAYDPRTTDASPLAPVLLAFQARETRRSLQLLLVSNVFLVGLAATILGGCAPTTEGLGSGATDGETDDDGDGGSGGVSTLRPHGPLSGDSGGGSGDGSGDTGADETGDSGDTWWDPDGGWLTEGDATGDGTTTGEGSATDGDTSTAGDDDGSDSGMPPDVGEPDPCDGALWNQRCANGGCTCTADTYIPIVCCCQSACVDSGAGSCNGEPCSRWLP